MIAGDDVLRQLLQWLGAFSVVRQGLLGLLAELPGPLLALLQA